MEICGDSTRDFQFLQRNNIWTMGKRYYCDYCDRSFKDDPEARKKHLSSLQHAKNRADHYNLFKDPELILQEEYAKTSCKRFMTVGDCAFGNGCRFSHYTPPMIWHLERIVSLRRESQSRFKPKEGWPDPSRIVNKFFQETRNLDSTDDFELPSWAVCNEYPDYLHLPPSLWPITPKSVTDSNFGKWGQ